jgi:hypothetical protein
MELHRREIHDVLTVSAGLIYFVFIGLGMVALALAAHLH